MLKKLLIVFLLVLTIWLTVWSQFSLISKSKANNSSNRITMPVANYDNDFGCNENYPTIGGVVTGLLNIRFSPRLCVTEDLIVPEGETLTMGNGNTLIFLPGRRMIVGGQLIARYYTHFTGDPEVGWGGIHFLPSAQPSECLYCNISNIESGGVALKVESPLIFRYGSIKNVPNGTAISSTVPITVLNTVIDSVDVGLNLSNKMNLPQKITYMTMSQCQSCVVNRGQNLVLDNSIFTHSEDAISTELSGTTTVSYSLFYSNTQNFMTEPGSQLIQGPGLLFEDPNFKNFPDNVHLMPASPAIDSADPQSDYRFEHRYNGGRANMGAYGNTGDAQQQPPLEQMAFTFTTTTTELIGRPGETVKYNLLLENKGTISDTYWVKGTLSQRQPFRLEGLNYTSDTDQYSKIYLDVKPQTTLTIGIGIKIPSNATNGMVNTTTLRVNGIYVGPTELQFATIVSTPTSIEQIGTLEITSSVQEMSAQGNYLFVATGTDGLHIFDVSEPITPTKVGSFNKGEGIWNVKVKDNYAYISLGQCEYSIEHYSPERCNADYYLLDVSNPASPVELDRYENWADIKIWGDYAYVLDKTTNLQRLDITDPTMPREVGHINGPIKSFTVTNDYLYILPPNNFRYGISPTFNGGYISDNYLKIFDLLSLEEISSYRMPDQYPVERVFIIGQYAYIYCYALVSTISVSGWNIVDISDPIQPSLMEKKDIYYLPFNPDRPGGNLYLLTQDNYAYLANYIAGLEIVDISNPAKPIKVDAFGAGQMAKAIAISEGHIYLANDEVDILRYPGN